ncbi:MAG: ATP-binding protein [Burkholderiaceae bacterium]|nr:ATP-binding protein [Burkholderiaceae bacterium]
MDSRPLMLWVVDFETRQFLSVNDEACRRYGYSSREFLGMLLSDIVADEASVDEDLRVAAPGRGGRLVQRQRIVQHRLGSGELMLVESSASPIEFSGRKAVMFVVTECASRDETSDVRLRNAALEQALRRTDMELDLARKVIDSFSYLVSHDLRSPLLVIDGFSTELEDGNGGELSPQGKHFVGRIRQSTQHMGRLIDEMLQLSRVTRAPLHKQPVDLTPVCQGLVDELRGLEPGRKVDVELAPALPCVADAAMLRLVMSQLLGNAWKFTSKRADAWIRVGMKTLPDHAEPVYFVSDNGAGFDMEQAGKLFVAFQRLHSTREFPGTGVGLAIAHRIVIRHGGQMWAESVQGQGSTFYFTLPQHAESATPLQIFHVSDRPE